jgi:hypothetical protein
MSRLLPLKGLLLNLKQQIPAHDRAYLSKERALALLRSWTHQDFGDDIDAWESWIASHEPDLDEVENE